MKPTNATTLGLAGAWLLIASAPLGADEAGHIKDLTKGDPYYYTSDQAIGEMTGRSCWSAKAVPRRRIPAFPICRFSLDT